MLWMNDFMDYNDCRLYKEDIQIFEQIKYVGINVHDVILLYYLHVTM